MIKKNTVKQYFLYLTRWQLSSPILFLCISLLHELSAIWQTIIANLIGGCLFYFIDKYIFNITKKFSDEVWEQVENVKCCDCGKVNKGYRLIFKKNLYNKIEDVPQFRCKECSEKKYQQFKDRMDLNAAGQ